MTEFWADGCHQYGFFWLKSQMLLSGEDPTYLKLAVFRGYNLASPWPFCNGLDTKGAFFWTYSRIGIVGISQTIII